MSAECLHVFSVAWRSRRHRHGVFISCLRFFLLDTPRLVQRRNQVDITLILFDLFRHIIFCLPDLAEVRLPFRDSMPSATDLNCVGTPIRNSMTGS